MHNRVHVDADELSIGSTVHLSDDESHHILNVRRAAAGDVVEVFCNSGRSYEGVIVHPTSPACVRITGNMPLKTRGAEICLFYGLTKYKALESAVSKCAELGVSVFYPVVCDRSIPEKLSAARKERLNKIIAEAVKQSRQQRVMKIDFTFSNIGGVLNSLVWKGCEMKVLLLPSAENKISEIIGGKNIKKVALFTGPEGDFSPEEVESFRKAGIQPCTLGDFTLRSDTAAMAAVSVVRAVWG
jgi:16S rRNA (uracil1498-N3)-methyltransferase